MSNSYTQIYLQLVFAVKYRAALINKQWSGRLHQYITGIFQKNRHKMLAINSMPDHIHIFIGMRPHQALSDSIKNVKAESTKWIKNNDFCKRSFAWQEGYGAFSYSRSQLTSVINYIKNQEKHHHKKSFLQEYRDFLTAFAIDFEERFIFKELI
jgi:putative transposase